MLIKGSVEGVGRQELRALMTGGRAYSLIRICTLSTAGVTVTVGVGDGGPEGVDVGVKVAVGVAVGVGVGGVLGGPHISLTPSHRQLNEPLHIGPIGSEAPNIWH